MNTSYGISNNNYNRFDLGGYSAGQFNYVQGNYAKTGNADITIITDDGDTVTISAENSLKTSYSTYSGLLRSASASAKIEGYDYSSELSSSLSLSVTGELDSEEYKDILKAVKTIESLMEKPFTGSMEDLNKLAQEFGGLDTLSSLDASIRIEESMSYEQTQAVVSEAVDSKGEGKRGNSEWAKMDHALDSILKAAKKAGKSHGDVREMMDNYLSGLIEMFSKKPGKNNETGKAGEQMKDMIMNRLDEKAKADTEA